MKSRFGVQAGLFCQALLAHGFDFRGGMLTLRAISFKVEDVAADLSGPDRLALRYRWRLNLWLRRDYLRLREASAMLYYLTGVDCLDGMVNNAPASTNPLGQIRRGVKPFIKKV